MPTDHFECSHGDWKKKRTLSENVEGTIRIGCHRFPLFLSFSSFCFSNHSECTVQKAVVSLKIFLFSPFLCDPSGKMEDGEAKDDAFVAPAPAPGGTNQRKESIRTVGNAGGWILDWTLSHNAHALSSIRPKTDDSSTNVRVYLRIRPPNEREKATGSGFRSCLTVDPANSNSVTIATSPVPQTFNFDHVADSSSAQEDVFQKVGKQITDTCLAGYNGTIFAYGQTGSGKTYTIQVRVCS